MEINVNTNDFIEYVGFGVAGNFAHHLQQAGEIVDFVNVVVDEENAPKGIFPFYLPRFDSFCLHIHYLAVLSHT